MEVLFYVKKDILVKQAEALVWMDAMHDNSTLRIELPRLLQGGTNMPALIAPGTTDLHVHVYNV